MKQAKNIPFLLENFYMVTRARISIHDADLNEIYSFPKTALPFCKEIQKKRSARRKCQECDKMAFEKVRKTGEPYTYICHCGLIETVAPIYHFGVLSGYIMMGQVTSRDYKAKQNIRSSSAAYFEGGEMLSAAVLQIPELEPSTHQAFVNLLSIISQFLTDANVISAPSRDRAENIRSYINRHFTENLTIDSISAQMDCSRATAMNDFKRKYGKTINAYITEKRLSLASKLLLESKDSVRKISQACGFSDQNYFSRIFIKNFKMTPTEYRRSEAK